MSGFCGLTVIETSDAAFTLRVAEPVTDAELTVIVVAPVPTDVARP